MFPEELGERLVAAGTRASGDTVWRGETIVREG